MAEEHPAEQSHELWKSTPLFELNATKGHVKGHPLLFLTLLLFSPLIALLASPLLLLLIPAALLLPPLIFAVSSILGTHNFLVAMAAVRPCIHGSVPLAKRITPDDLGSGAQQATPAATAQRWFRGILEKSPQLNWTPWRK